jgi:hypothetical protein
MLSCVEGDLKSFRDSIKQVENEVNNLRQDRRTKVNKSSLINQL